ncbi:phytochrome and flowering time regulatory protein [Actinidia rufa]|uniref:Phytochrome and flowering time regulatory protein n=1 Tax=Actinidia rufa TaxID=165716 RepID=A0A7J0DKX8_9ERIC|nr:phytochrome and flowering time regulatory protein [Actinidia rufa]
MVIDGRSLAVMFDDGDEAANAVDTDTPEALSEDSDQGTEGDHSEKYLDDTSQPLGDGDPASTQCVRQNAQDDSVNPQSKPSAAAGDRNKDNGSQDKKKSYVSLFARNRLPSTGSKLDFFNLEDGPIPIEKEEIQLSDWPWESSIEDQDAVLDNGPYMIYGCPLLLKSMDKYFNFGKEEISTFPVWIQMRGVPFTLWNPMTFGKICSRLGKPIHMDKLTTQKERVTYARCLVEIDMAKKLVHSVDLLLPEGGVHQQMIYYENLPKYCPLCKVVGHTKENCKSITKPTNKAAEPNIASSDQGPRGAAGQPSGMVAKGVNHEPNKESIPEPNPEPISEIQSLLIELNPVNITELVPESNPIPPPEPNREPISKANLEPSSVSPPKQFQETYPMQSPPPQQLGGEIYIELANHIASKEMRKQVNSNQRKNPPVGSLKNGVLKHLKKIRPVIMGLIETKLSTQSLERLSKNKLCGWKMVDNFNRHPNGRILVIWKEELVALVILETFDQAIHCQATYKSSGLTFLITFVYAFNTAVGRRSLWENLRRVMVNNEWAQRGMLAQAQYDPPGKLSDHSPCSVSFMEEDNCGPIPFKFFNMWVKHDNFQAVSLNKLHFSHISIRSMGTEEELQQAQQQLHNNPNDSELQAAIPILRAKALKLAEAEMSFCSQIAKAKFLKNTDKGTKFFHNMIKSKRTRNNIPSLSLEDGSRSTSSKQVRDAFVQYYRGLLGTKRNCSRLNPDIARNGRILDQSQSIALVLPVTEEEIKNGLFSIGVDKASGPDGYSSLFFKGDPTSVSLLMEKLNYFGECSGLCINQTKSCFHAAGICDPDLERIKEISGFPQGSFPFRFLGIPVADSRLTISQYSPLIDRISDSISAWAGAILSYARRTELIKSVLQGVECYWLSILPIPAGVKSKIVQLCRNFLWSGKCTINKKPLVAWKEVTLPKIEGGLGLRNPKAWNKALLSKTLWDIQSKKDSLWVQWVHQVYLKGGCFWEYKNKHSDSPLLKQIMILRDEIIGAETVERASLTLHQWAPNGKFQSRLAYEFFRPRNAKLTWPKLVWHAAIIPRHSFILWLGLKDRLLTKNKLRDYIEDQSCPLCSAQNETLNHLFFQCTFGKQIWANIKSWLGISRAMQSLKATVKWLIKEARGTGFPAKIKRIGIACMVYSIWEARNKRIFEGKVEQPDAISRPGDYPAAPGPCSSFSSLVPDVDVDAVLKLLLLMLKYDNDDV